jgi:hypothetical protein
MLHTSTALLAHAHTTAGNPHTVNMTLSPSYHVKLDALDKDKPILLFIVCARMNDTEQTPNECTSFITCFIKAQEGVLSHTEVCVLSGLLHRTSKTSQQNVNSRHQEAHTRITVTQCFHCSLSFLCQLHKINLNKLWLLHLSDQISQNQCVTSAFRDKPRSVEGFPMFRQRLQLPSSE